MRHAIKAKLLWSLVWFFGWLSLWAERMRYRLKYCPDCGRNVYTGKP